MPVIAPFRALRYAPRLHPVLDRLVAPPYDVQTEEQRLRRAAREENSIVHLDLPQPGDGGDRYVAAAHLLQRWMENGILVRDPGPAYYLCEQRYLRPSGDETTRRGFFARLTLEPLSGGSVVPHERTFDQPRTDRMRLLAATRVHLSAVFLLHPDPGGEVTRLVATGLGPETLEEARDDDGTISRVVRLADRDKMEFLTSRLRDQWALIADGHHRYESALAYRDARRAREQRDAEHVLAFFCSLEDAGLTIYPIHRLVHSLAGFDPEPFRKRLAAQFRLTPAATADDMERRLSSKSSHPGVFGLVLPGNQRFVAEWKGEVVPEAAGMAETPGPLRRLDVVLLHRLVLEDILGITPEALARQSHLDYVKDAREVHERVADGRAQIGIQMNPTRIEQVIEVTRGGLRLPQKSTYFFPKVITGLVLDPLD